MSDFGPKRTGTAPRGRPKKKPDYDRQKNIQELLEQAVKLFEIPFDDRDERPPVAPTISFVAGKMKTSRMRVRKLLITADFFSSATSRKVQEMHRKERTIQEISDETGLGRAAVHSYLPYEKGIYKMDELSLNAEQCLQFQKRRKACEQLREHIEDESLEYLWKAIQAFEQYNFRKQDQSKVRYTIDGEKLCFGNLTISRKEIEDAFREAREIQNAEGCVCDAKKLCCSGAEELYTVFLRIGACCKLECVSKLIMC